MAGYQLSLKDLRDLVTRFRKLSYSERLAIPGMSDKRSEIILAGALILQEAMTLLGMESLTVCDRSLREGVIVDWMLAHGLIENRLRYQGSIRQRSILHMAEKYQVNSRTQRKNRSICPQFVRPNSRNSAQLGHRRTGVAVGRCDFAQLRFVRQSFSTPQAFLLFNSQW